MDLDRFKRWMGLRTLYLKWTLPLRFPLILNIEPTNRCNLACRMCPRAISHRPVTDLDWGLFERLADELGRHGPILKVFLQKDGEPLCHPRLAEMVALLREVRAARRLSVITNGTLLTEDRFAALAEAGLHDLIVSIDATNPTDYQALKGLDAYDRVVANVERALALKRRHGWRFPEIKARLVARQGHETEIEAFRHQWEGKADFVDITPYHTWLGAVKDERAYGGRPRYPCALLWYTGVVNADGRVSPCCIDFNLEGDLGRVGEGGFAAIWNGPALRRLRRAHIEGDYRRTAICGPCEYWLIKEDLGSWLRRRYGVPEPSSPPPRRSP
ncbi:MAG: radical SAM protein [Candidatus Riflebacteria bacterium]|nr:radical SAM protein [Candidatus Riflebacteria bacterium]